MKKPVVVETNDASTVTPVEDATVEDVEIVADATVEDAEIDADATVERLQVLPMLRSLPEPLGTPI